MSGPKNRDTVNESPTSWKAAPEFFGEYSGHLGVIYNNSVLPLTDVAGADTITATVDPLLPSAGLVTGMKFTIKWAADNTGAATLNIGGAGAVSIVGKSGEALSPGQLSSGARDQIEFDGTNFVLVTGGAETGESITGRTAYTYSDTWTNDYPDNTIVMVECWGSGAGGGPVGGGYRGGGGGAYNRAFFKAGDLPSTVSITVPSGGSYDNNGGACTFGAYLTANGGRRGRDSGNGGRFGPGDDIASTYFGGGNANADAVWGGAGGAETGTAKSSEFGGSGGVGSGAGSAPGGGGGSTGAGARGECRVTVF